MQLAHAVSISCPKCGAPLQINDKQTACPYCRNSLYVELGESGEVDRGHPHRITIEKPIHLEMVLIPGGEFLMGASSDLPIYAPKPGRSAANDERPQHSVYVSDFYISRFPLTWGQSTLWEKSSGEKRVIDPAMKWCYGLDGKTNKARLEWLHQARLDYRNEERIDDFAWEEAQAILDWLMSETGYPWMLPTESEWEKAARGTDGRLFPWGNQEDDSFTYNNTDWLQSPTDPGENVWIPLIGKYSPRSDSPYSVADMLGYADEWCKDAYGLAYKTRANIIAKDPCHPQNKYTSQVVVRGHWQFARKTISSRGGLLISSELMAAVRPVFHGDIIQDDRKQSNKNTYSREPGIISQGKVGLKDGDYAAAIDPVGVRALAVKTVSPNANQAAWNWYQPASIYEYIKKNVRYVSDPLGRNYIAPPLETLQVGGGDCEDQAILLASMCNAVGIPVRLVICNSSDDRCHCLAEVDFGKIQTAEQVNVCLRKFYAYRPEARPFHWENDNAGHSWVIADLAMCNYFGDMENLVKNKYISQNPQDAGWRWIKPVKYIYPQA
jgi:formylglycine-generating enzyme required for sulfatase activity